MSLRIGHGLDVHRLVPGRALRLGCVDIPHDLGLAGHSDGDVAVHALCDALLGAAGLGDMGARFPSSDARWRDTSGRDFLVAVAELLAGVGALLGSAQVVVVAQSPRLAQRLGAMETAIAQALGVAEGTVRVAATTSDTLGATGRGEGIAASAVALVEVP